MILYLTIGLIHAVVFLLCWVYKPFKFRFTTIPVRLVYRYWKKEDDRWVGVIWALLHIPAWPVLWGLAAYFYWKDR